MVRGPDFERIDNKIKSERDSFPDPALMFGVHSLVSSIFGIVVGVLIAVIASRGHYTDHAPQPSATLLWIRDHKTRVILWQKPRLAADDD